MYGFGQFAYSPGSMSDMQNRMNQQYTRPMNNNMMVVPLSGRIVTGIEEARASQIALDGTPSYFPSPAENKIYVKSLDMNGVPMFLTYKLETPSQVMPMQDMNIETRLSNIENRLKEIENHATNATNSNA